MISNSAIHEAIQMINTHDWFWMMTDSGYDHYRESAKSHMRAFVKVVSTIENANTREMLRNLWILRWEAARDSINGKKDDENQAKQDALMNALTVAA